MVRSASCPISKDSRVSKSFLVFVGTVGSVRGTQVGILLQGVSVASLAFKLSLVMIISFRISTVFFALVAHSFHNRYSTTSWKYHITLVTVPVHHGKKGEGSHCVLKSL